MQAGENLAAISRWYHFGNVYLQVELSVEIGRLGWPYLFDEAVTMRHRSIIHRGKGGAETVAEIAETDGRVLDFQP